MRLPPQYTTLPIVGRKRWYLGRVTAPKATLPTPVPITTALDLPDLAPGVYRAACGEWSWTIRVLPDGRILPPEGPVRKKIFVRY